MTELLNDFKSLQKIKIFKTTLKHKHTCLIPEENKREKKTKNFRTG